MPAIITGYDLLDCYFCNRQSILLTASVLFVNLYFSSEELVLPTK